MRDLHDLRIPEDVDDDPGAWAVPVNGVILRAVPGPLEPAPDGEAAPSRAVDGAAFVSSVGDTVPAIWGSNGSVIWPEGEPLMIVGPDGVGKTSIAQQLTLARIGLRNDLLGHPVAPGRRVLYIAADRPRQAASSLRRMVSEKDHDVLRERLVVWKGPLEFGVGGDDTDKNALADLASRFGATDVVIDSLKDVAVDLVKDSVGSRVNIAIQETIARGIEVCVLHHQRKEQQGGGKPKKLADVYGSRWLVAGMGSVVCLWGDAGDLVVEFSHIKQPVEDVGPFQIVHDHDRGAATIYEQADLEQMLTRTVHGLTVAETAALIFQTADPNRNQIEKARRKLEALVSKQRAKREDDAKGTAHYFTLHRAA